MLHRGFENGLPYQAQGVRQLVLPAQNPSRCPGEDREWIEGRPRLVTHLRRERAAGLAEAKKQQFIKIHGRLYCEQCGMDPVKVYDDPHGVAVIEVHHAALHVEDMPDSHRTRLEDVKCLCANCHRYVHRLLKMQLVGAGAQDGN